MIIARLALGSLFNRKTTAILTISSIALSVFLLLGVEKLRTGLKQSFLQTISGVDLVIGPRTSGVQLLLYSVFHIGFPSNNITMASLHELEKKPEVSWIVPILLGDSHRGYSVVGTRQEYFDHLETPGGKPLEFSSGTQFSSEGPETVIGAEVAEKLGYSIGSEFTTSHGMGEVSFSEHDQKFRVVGVLERTGTSTDISIFISLNSFNALHEDQDFGHKSDTRDSQHMDETHEGGGHEEEHGHDGHEDSHEEGHKHDEYEGGNEKEHKHAYNHEEEHMHGGKAMATAALVGLNSKVAALNFQRYVNEYPLEPLTAVIPGVAFSEIWRVVSQVESAFLFIAALVGFTAIVGMTMAILATLNQRNREMAILRSVGANPFSVSLLFVIEAVVLAGTGAIIGLGCVYFGLWIMQDEIIRMAGLYIPIGAPGLSEVIFLGMILAGAMTGGIIPAIRAYRMTLTEGLSMRL